MYYSSSTQSLVESDFNALRVFFYFHVEPPEVNWLS